MYHAKRPAPVLPPGELIREELEARGWTQRDLAEVLGRPPQVVNQIVTGKKRITPDTAAALAAAFGTSPHVWMNLETAYQLSRVRVDAEAVAERAKAKTSRVTAEGKVCTKSA